MKFLSLFIFITLSFSAFARAPKTLVCVDAEFGAGHMKIIIPDNLEFFTPKDQKSSVKSYFWIKGEMYTGFLESAMFLPDWGTDSGWYRSSPSPLNFSLCNWEKCPLRKIKFMVHTKDQLKGEGNIRFVIQTSKKERVKFERRLNCELK